jgi:hypothetical protein
MGQYAGNTGGYTGGTQIYKEGSITWNNGVSTGVFYSTDIAIAGIRLSYDEGGNQVAGVLMATDGGVGKGWLRSTAGQDISQTDGAVVSGTTLTAVSGFSGITLKPYRMYKIKGMLRINAATPGNGVKFDLGGGTTDDNYVGVQVTVLSDGVPLSVADSFMTDKAPVSPPTVQDVVSTGFTIKFEGIFEAGPVGGTLKFRIANYQNTSNLTCPRPTGYMVAEDMGFYAT